MIHLNQQCFDASVWFAQREEGVMAQARQYPALNDFNGHLGLRLYSLAYRVWQAQLPHRMGRQLLVSRVYIQIVATGFGYTAFEVIRYHDLWHAFKDIKGSGCMWPRQRYS